MPAMMIKPQQRRFAHRTLLAGISLLVMAFGTPSAFALPFDPLPSAFQRWLNSRHDWPNNEQRRFINLRECSDQSAASSPYRMRVFTCLRGSVTIQRPGELARTCPIQRVSYFPTNQQVRLWTGSCH